MNIFPYQERQEEFAAMMRSAVILNKRRGVDEKKI